MNEQLRFPMLSASRFSETNERAKDSIRKGLQPPAFEQFRGNVVSEYPRWFLFAISAVLFLVLIFSFTISAGKQAAAAGMLFDHLPNTFGRLSELWATASVAFMLLLSEVGAVLFLVGAGTLAQSAPNAVAFGRAINPTAILFRLFAVLCAGYAILSNITITALDPIPQAAVLQWAVSIGIPSVVLGLGTMLERLLVDALKTRRERKMRYEKALHDYQVVQADPVQHSSWNAVLADELWRELTKYKRDRDLLEAIVGDDREVRRTILVLEYQAQRRAETIDWSIEVPVTSFIVSSVAATGLDSIAPNQTPALSQGRIAPQKPPQDGPAVAKAKAWLAEHHDHGLSLRNAAEQAGVSKDSMARAINDSQ